MKGKKCAPMKMGGKVKGYAKGGAVKKAAPKKGSISRGMGKATKGGSFSGCY